MADMKIGILGFGTVGKGVAKILLNERAMLEQRAGCTIELLRIADLDTVTDRGIKLPLGMLISDAQAIIDDPAINTIIEVIGGENAAKKFIEAALMAKKNVITSNKEVIAKHGKYFTQLAKQYNCTLLYEASVCGGIPVLHALRNSLSANTIERMYGIVNGTTNFILSKMSETGATFADTLKEAQKLGYAEADPKNDVEGYDATYKLSILSSLAFRCPVNYSEIYREGITSITAEDIASAQFFGYTVKILAVGINKKEGLELRVHPVMIPNSHPLASVNDAFNAIFIRGSSLGDCMLYGRGAGELPTASAVVGDVMNLAFRKTHSFPHDIDFAILERKVLPIADSVTSFFVRCIVKDAPGVLASYANIFAKYEVSIHNIRQMDTFNGNEKGKVTITIITHPTREKNLRDALAEIEKLPTVSQVASVIRVGLDE